MTYTECTVSVSELVDGFSILSVDITQDDIAIATEMLQHAVNAGINNAPRAAIFLANCAHESMMFSRMEENLNYSAKRLKQVWPARFKTASALRRCAYNPKELANYVYNGRMGNRMGSDDGWNYRGGGYIQLTGYNNYKRCTERTGMPIDTDPDSLRTDKITAWWASIDFFVNARYKGRSLLELADNGQHELVCRGINGGTHGLNERTAFARMLLEVFTQSEGLFTLPLAKHGDRGGRVKPVQQKLRLLGYKIYSIDGIFGKGTQQAVMQFQSDHGLQPDGVVGGRTLFAINTEFSKRIKD